MKSLKALLIALAFGVVFSSGCTGSLTPEDGSSTPSGSPSAAAGVGKPKTSKSQEAESKGITTDERQTAPDIRRAPEGGDNWGGGDSEGWDDNW